MRFVHKPRPYSSGVLDRLGLGGPKRPRRSGSRPRRSPPPRPGRRLWGGAPVTALSVLGLVVTLMIGGAALYNQATREAQFAAVGQAISGLSR